MVHTPSKEFIPASKSKVSSIPRENYYTTVIDSLKEYALFTTDKTGNINSWNSGAQNIFGYKEDEILGKNYSVLFSKKDIARRIHRRELRIALEKGKSLDEHLHVHKSGAEFWGHGMIFPIFNDNNEHLGFTKLTQDITKRKEEEEEKQRLQDREYAESIVRTAREPMLVLNKDLTINTINQPFFKLFKVRKKKLQDFFFYNLCNRQFDNPQLRSLIEKILANEAAFSNHEMELDLRTIGKRSLMLNIRKLYRKNKTEMILLAIEDITQKKALEQQKDDFISIASHELKTPATHIKGLVQIIKRQSQHFNNEGFSKSLQLLSDQAERFSKLVNDLLDISRIKTGKLSLDKQSLNLNSIVHETVESFKAITKTHEIVIEGEISKPIVADLYKIYQILSNLISNAVKYSPEGKYIVITLSENKDRTAATVCVKDFGMGIPKNEQDKLFKRFSRTSIVKQQNIPGIGLGLHITSEIVKQHGGKIWFKSKEREGASFYFSLPIQTASELS